MEPIRINIPDRIPDPAHEAAGIVMQRLRANGIDPRKAIAHPLLRQITITWSRGSMSDQDFDTSCRNLLIMNPGLAG